MMTITEMLKIRLDEARQSRDYFAQKAEMLEAELAIRGVKVPE